MICTDMQCSQNECRHFSNLGLEYLSLHIGHLTKSSSKDIAVKAIRLRSFARDIFISQQMLYTVRNKCKSSPNLVEAHLSWCNLSTVLKTMRAVTCDFQQCGILTCVDSDEPAQPPVKLKNSK